MDVIGLVAVRALPRGGNRSARREPRLHEDPVNVILRRRDRDHQRGRDLLVAAPARDQRCHFALTRGEERKEPGQLRIRERLRDRERRIARVDAERVARARLGQLDEGAPRNAGAVLAGERRCGIAESGEFGGIEVRSGHE